MVGRAEGGEEGGDLPDIPAPIITTVALVWSLFPIGTSGQGLSPVMMYRLIVQIFAVYMYI
jgi:hypothetical protein